MDLSTFLVFFLVLMGMWVEASFQETNNEALSYSKLDSPFRMNKLNLLWDKVLRSKHLLQESKLKAFYNSLKLQEKEEFALKKIKGEGKDKDGSFEAQVRKKFKNLLEEFSLRHYGEDGEDILVDGAQRRDAPFGDKKLARLWDKAGNLGLKDEALHRFKAELLQYQQETKEYQQLLELAHAESLHQSNQVSEDSDSMTPNLNEKRRELKDKYEHLQMRLVNAVPILEDEFTHPEVQDLWRFALDANFSEDELQDVIKKELILYEKKLNKIRHLEEELKMVDERQGGKYNDFQDHSEGRKILDQKLKKHEEAIEELRIKIKHLILTRHTEL
ncbi:alpha-2-macroglobulin receptor-associated protein [Lepeophtheirus salmonis]|uniref:Alpha-2-macroglobulin receptor-associated protein n=1 Tax=Lepeophtheirus salmonis TaxID=72036 RepID=D3PHF3_LEPSM|nr:alpha-2-macroglobulin receptor-associated protein-like [Lepeophtheirus salmonis]XP_040581435.1 alpha-2-macroglobulin receptor-associated protein-like [Lepeophtheirus salmonis]ADD37989.1 Alpha-2-macroglobulin receptor-associated protein [Lepeophtheirus salmonis]